MALTVAQLELGDHRLSPEERLDVQPHEFSQAYRQPQATFRIRVGKARGRCGDLLVCQLRSANGATERQIATLRSLGLGRYHDVSLRWSDDDVTLGYLRAVRHLVGVVHLHTPCYKEGIGSSFETQQYGTPSRPGQVWRALSGEYFGYNSDKSGLAAFMSTACDLQHVLAGVQRVEIDLEPDSASPDTVVNFRERDTGKWQAREGFFSHVMDGIEFETIGHALIPLKSIGRVSTASVQLTISWDAEVRRFHDIDRVSAELGVIASGANVNLVRHFRTFFSELVDREDVPIEVWVFDKGRRSVEV